MNKLEGLKFDTPNNAALSLRMLAELVRQGEIEVLASNTRLPGTLDLFLNQRGSERLRAEAM